MTKLLRAQFYRLFKTKAFWSWLIVICALPLASFVINVVAYANQETFTSLEDYFQLSNTLLGGAEGTSYVMTFFSGLTNYSSDFVLCALICSGVVLGKEFSNGTIRNAIVSDKSRTQVYFCYLIVAFAVGVTYMLAFSAVVLLTFGVAVGFAKLAVGKVITGVLTSLLLGTLAVAFSSTCTTMFLFTTNKQSSAVVLPLLICLFAEVVAQIIFVVLLMFDAGNIGANFTGEWIPILNKTLFDASDVQGKTVGQIALYDVAFSALFTLLGWLRFRKSDMK